jgi:drug/metabolite transporter (DMT)-like permease
MPTIAGIVLAAVGLYLLNGANPSFGKGELLTLGCAVCFAVHIILLAEFAPRYDALRLNAVQLSAVGAVCFLPGFFTGGYGFPLSVWLAAIYTGVAASAVAFGLMVWAQRRVSPSRTALLLMLEPVFAAVAGAIAGDHLGLVGVAGAALILVGVLVAELRRPPVVTIPEL